MHPLWTMFRFASGDDGWLMVSIIRGVFPLDGGDNTSSIEGINLDTSVTHEVQIECLLSIRPLPIGGRSKAFGGVDCSDQELVSCSVFLSVSVYQMGFMWIYSPSDI